MPDAKRRRPKTSPSAFPRVKPPLAAEDEEAEEGERAPEVGEAVRGLGGFYDTPAEVEVLFGTDRGSSVTSESCVDLLLFAVDAQGVKADFAGFADGESASGGLKDDRVTGGCGQLCFGRDRKCEWLSDLYCERASGCASRQEVQRIGNKNREADLKGEIRL